MALVGGLAGLVLETSAQTIRVEGIIKYTAYGERGAIPTVERRFTGRFNQCSWSITITNRTAATNKIQYTELAYVGTEVFCLEVHGNAGLEKLEKMNRLRGASPLLYFRDVATITPGPVPFSGPGVDVGPIWFAYGSACYLDSRKGLGLKPIWVTHPRLFKESKYVFAANVVRSPDPPHLPTTVYFISDGRMYDSTGENFVEHDGYTNAVFTASEFVRIADVSLAKEFKLTLFRPNLSTSKSAGLTVACKWEGVASDVSVDSEPAIALPKIRTNTFVSDYRPDLMTKLGKVDYGITNGCWVSVGDPTIERAEIRAKQIDSRWGKSASGKAGKTAVFARIVIGSIFTCSLIALLFLTRRSCPRTGKSAA